jgi:GT2 family glycosyltransferase/Ser/Thr protein kinase RdoA (MazF antagonist)
MTHRTSATSHAAEADWRFLLPATTAEPFDHVLLLGGSEHLPSTLVTLGVARRVSRALPEGVKVDALVILADANVVSLDAVAPHLQSDGVLYWEIDRRAARRLALTPGRAMKQLRRFGLTPAATYWVKPGFAERQMYLPFAAAGAFRWYLNTLHRSRTPSTLLINAALRALAVTAHGLRALAPCFAVTAVRGPVRPAAIAARARAEGVAVSEDASPVLLAHGRNDWNRIVMLWFEPGSDTPAATMKFPRVRTFNDRIDWEHQVLQGLSTELEPSLRVSVPASTRFSCNGLAVTSQTCVRGASLHSRAGPVALGVFEDLGHAAGWLAAFHQRTTIHRTCAREWVTAHLVNGVCKEYAEAFGLTPAEASLFEAVARRAVALDGHTVPIAWQHADFCPQNVYLDGDRVSVIDWETARRGPALADLLSFIAYWGADVSGCGTDEKRLEHFDVLFFAADRAHPYLTAIDETIAEYMRRLDMPRTLLPFLIVYTFVEKALEDARRVAVLDVPPARPRARTLEVAFVERMADKAEQLLGGGSAPAFHPSGDRADVTVAIATADRPLQLARSITAILSGSMLPAELIVVDQSTDFASADAIAATAGHHGVAVTYVRQPRLGLAASRNAAIARATRPIIVFTDDDCVPHWQWLARVVASFTSAAQPDAVAGRILALGPERPGFHAMSTHVSNVRALFRGRSLPWKIGSGANTAVRRGWLERVGGFDESLGVGSPGQAAEDVDLVYRLLAAGAAIQYEPDAIVFHERADTPRRLATSRAYGFGMGTFCARWIRRGDAYGVCMLAGWCVDRVRALGGACLYRRWWRLREEGTALRGLLDGIADGLTARARAAVPIPASQRTLGRRHA